VEDERAYRIEVAAATEPAGDGICASGSGRQAHFADV
jgi:hypothetical protein